MTRYLSLMMLVATGCGTSDAPVPGEPDAGIADASPFDQNDIQGRVCGVIDLRFPWACPAAASVAGLEVTETVLGESVTTAADGRFGFDIVDGARELVLEMTGDDRMSSLVQVAPDALTEIVLPAIALGPWQSYLVQFDEQAPTLGDLAYVLVAMESAQAERVEGAIVVGPADMVGKVFYNLGDAFTWADVGQTSSTGVAVLTGVPVDQDRISLIVRAPGDADVKTVEVQVRAGFLSLVLVTLDI